MRWLSTSPEMITSASYSTRMNIRGQYGSLTGSSLDHHRASYSAKVVMTFPQTLVINNQNFILQGWPSRRSFIIITWIKSLHNSELLWLLKLTGEWLMTRLGDSWQNNSTEVSSFCWLDWSKVLIKSYFRIFWHENLLWPHWWGSGKKYSTMKVLGHAAGNCGWVFLPFEFSKESFILKFCFSFLLSLLPLSFCLSPPSFPSMVSCWIWAQWVAAVNLPSIRTEHFPGVSLAQNLRLLLHPVGITLFIFPADTNHP